MSCKSGWIVFNHQVTEGIIMNNYGNMQEQRVIKGAGRISADKPVPVQAPIPAALVQLSERLDYLHTRLERLGVRLEPLVLHRQPGVNPTATPTVDSSAFTHAVNNNIAQVQAMIDKVCYLDEVLEL